MRKRRTGDGDAHGQLFISWNGCDAAAASNAVHPAAADKTKPSPFPLVQRLPWDFRQTFPQPTPEAIDAGVIDESDLEPENLAGLHENYANQCLATLKSLDLVMGARRKGVDPGTGKVPGTFAAKERLRRYLAEEPARLERTFTILMETYGNAFGNEAAIAFTKALRARHAGIEVVAEGGHSRVADAENCPAPNVETTQPKPAVIPRSPKRQHRPAGAASLHPRVVVRLPVPRPLPEAVRAGHFGYDEQGKPISPHPDEVHAITINHAQKLIEMLDTNPTEEQADFRAAVQAYAEDFGQSAAARLEAYARRRAALGEMAEPTKGRGR